MRRFPKGGLLGKIQDFLLKLQRMEIPTHASHACYFIVLAFFPALVLVLGMLRYTSLEASDLMGLAEGLLPDALEPYIWKLISGTYENTSKVVVSVSALTALWSAGRGIYGLCQGLNAVYGVEEERSWFHTRLISSVYTILFLLVLLLTLVLHVFGNTLIELFRADHAIVTMWTDLIDLRFFLLVFTQTMLFGGMFMYLPARKNGFRESLPGALFASLGWMTFSSAFSVYVENFSRYTNIYGSVYAVALAMLWLYMCVSILFYGAVLNRFLMEGRKK